MPRRLFTLCSTLSLLTCVATLVLWGASLNQSIPVRVRSGPGRADFVVFAGGGAYVVRQEVAGAAAAGGAWAADVGEYGGLRVRAAGGGQALAEITFGGPGPPGGGSRPAWGVTSFRVAGPRATFHTPAGAPATVGLVMRGAGAPCWLLALGTAALPAAWLRGYLRRRRLRADAARGLCRSCGYDLRATPGRCPECGAVAVGGGALRGGGSGEPSRVAECG